MFFSLAVDPSVEYYRAYYKNVEKSPSSDRVHRRDRECLYRVTAYARQRGGRGDKSNGEICILILYTVGRRHRR